mmetsp:Transcript_25621/g.56071  ORF Transcript_25621/g.56071 Transcript_25621/m.56071 type:complete len:665 (-) Transcript_25621:2353-4347(-)
MADSVDAAMDAMVPALQDLLSKGIFSDQEIRAIVSRRRQYEYLLRRRQARKADFLAYIEDETKLERLRSLRNRKLLARKRYEEQKDKRLADKEGKGRHGDKKTTTKKASYSSIGDASIVQLIHLIYTRAIRKWRDDVALHLEHAQFAKNAKSWKKLGRIYTEALQLHPHNIVLWIEAASHEYFGQTDHGTEPDRESESDSIASSGGSVANARVLLQRGLRVNPWSKDLWLQYFSLELHYIQKLRGRREILQLGLNKKGLAETAANEDDVESSAQIPLIVFKNALKSIPDEVDFRLKFVGICRMFPETEGIERFIMSTVKRDFANAPEAWIARAQYATDASAPFREEPMGLIPGSNTMCVGGENDSDALRILDEATDAISSAEMYLAAINFLKRTLADDDADCDSSRDDVFLGHLFQKAANADVSSPELSLEHSRYLVSTGDVDSAISLLHDVVDDGKIYCANDALLLELTQLIERVQKAGSQSHIFLLERALERIPIHSDGHITIAVCLFRHYLSLSSQELSAAKKRGREMKVSDLLGRILLLSNGKDRSNTHNIPELCLAYLQNANMLGGLKAARRAYKSVLFKSNYAASCEGKSDDEIAAMKVFFDACIALEQLSVAVDQDARALLRKLYNSAIVFFTGPCSMQSVASEYKKRQSLLLRNAK